jgi:glycosyltransferase involved in cell wall biosynthesis
MRLKIAILGTRGIPNYYGGFEQFAEYLAKGLVERDFEVTVYNSHNHPYQQKSWNGVEIIHCFDPEDKIGTAGQFVYDLNCIKDSRRRDFDIILQLGYTSSSVWNLFLPRKRTVITTNMDGLEWKRSKYSKPVQQFLKRAESLAIKFSHHLIADSKGIKEYLHQKYRKEAIYIPYGSHVFENPDESILDNYALSPYKYNMLIARLEPENSVETILRGVHLSLTDMPFLVVGKHTTKYGEYLKEKFCNDNRIQFLGGIYDINVLNNLRYFSNLYFHGHTVGGTNPSLLEAMGSNALIVAHDNLFNKSILGKDGFYFSTAEQVQGFANITDKTHPMHEARLENNLQKIRDIYSWDNIVDQYADHFYNIKGIRSKQFAKEYVETDQIGEKVA